MKTKREIPEWLQEEIRDIKSQEFWEMEKENEEREEQDLLNDWINKGGY